jgi:hypothetical protein
LPLPAFLFLSAEYSGVQAGQGSAHLGSLGARVLNLNQRAPTHSGTVGARRLEPLPPAVYQFRPEGENAALSGFGGMDGAAVSLQKVATGVGGNAQTGPVARAEDIPPFELRRLQFQVRRYSHDIVLTEIDKAPLTAAFRTTGLALESKSLCHGTIIHRPTRLPACPFITTFSTRLHQLPAIHLIQIQLARPASWSAAPIPRSNSNCRGWIKSPACIVTFVNRFTRSCRAPQP